MEISNILVRELKTSLAEFLMGLGIKPISIVNSSRNKSANPLLLMVTYTIFVIIIYLLLWVFMQSTLDKLKRTK